ncbi:uncharacterized protein LOC125501703 isoform X1 [Athalia rosae]|uniref:uncharacterized protein LOC125501703 isoform X1 n=1 Tax=Athalia rosae TaxID=37344 RepID=UPI002033A9EB|nr:uncharacterized protein LOC125501703 isoform X1 [Athalia rosae]XP_048514116.1 uncharacterized protein LOC125501703 isoform X1 [Athalia rosae]XP_048514117.1 uncharacterized protein LOC125501703 isoform X1 [Athalia rosae]
MSDHTWSNCICPRGECKVETTESLRYTSDVIITPLCTLTDSQCRCSPGQVQLPNPSISLLYFWKRHREFEGKKSYFLVHVSTQELQSFHGGPSSKLLFKFRICHPLEIILEIFFHLGYEMRISWRLVGLYKENYNHGIRDACINLHRSHNFQAYYYARQRISNYSQIFDQLIGNESINFMYGIILLADSDS